MRAGMAREAHTFRWSTRDLTASSMALMGVGGRASGAACATMARDLAGDTVVGAGGRPAMAHIPRLGRRGYPRVGRAGAHALRAPRDLGAAIT
ncbi:MAG: hypothetical protein AMXMBFR64_05650 [Myxococcales bacterium]